MKFKHDKELKLRMNRFKKNHDRIEAHNKKKGIRYHLTHNKFSTMVQTVITK